MSTGRDHHVVSAVAQRLNQHLTLFSEYCGLAALADQNVRHLQRRIEDVVRIDYDLDDERLIRDCTCSHRTGIACKYEWH